MIAQTDETEDKRAVWKKDSTQLGAVPVAISVVLCGAWLGAACGDIGGREASGAILHSSDRVRTSIRPTEGDGWQGNGYGDVKVYSHPSPGGRFKVWYTLEGEHAVRAADTSPSDGVPDYVQTVAAKLDESRRVLVGDVGLRAPLDDALYHDGEDYGGDSRFDVYLQDLEQNDGYRVIESCIPSPARCAGYFVMENDFAEFNYPSVEVGIEVVTSHEYAHALEDAYTANLPRFLSEGLATWAQERVFPDQSDYERALRAFFRESGRPLPSEEAGNPADPFPYGTAIWPTYLAERFGEDVLAELLVAVGNAQTNETKTIWDATDEVLRSRDSGLGPAFVEFALWNLLTGEREDLLSDEGYDAASSFPEVDVREQTWRVDDSNGKTIEFSAKRLSAAYTAADVVSESPVTADVIAKGRLRFAVFASGSSGSEGPIYLRPAGGLDRANLRIPGGTQLFVVAANAVPDEGALDGRIELQTVDPAADGGDVIDAEDFGRGRPDAGSDAGTDVDRSTPDVTSRTPRNAGSGGAGCALATSQGNAPRAWFALPFLAVFVLGAARRRLLALTVLASTGLAVGCVPPSERASKETDQRETPSFERSDEAPDPTGKFVHEAYGIGASWYDYDGSTHTLTPHAEWYRLKRGDGGFAIQVESYYDDRGESGFFTLSVRTRGDDGWSAPQQFEATTNVKDERVCVDLEARDEVGCDAERWHLLLRTDYRVVPRAGFAVANPAIYARGHYARASKSPPALAAVSGDAPDASTLDREGVELPSSRLDLDDSAIGPLRDNAGERRVRGDFVHATADMQFVRWRVTDVSFESDGAAVTVGAACASLAPTRDEQSFPGGELRRERLDLPSEGDYGVVLAELCDDGPTAHARRSKPLQGDWPPTKQFDLIVERWRGRVAIRLPPGHLVFKAGRSLAQPESVSSVDEIPGNLWGE